MLLLVLDERVEEHPRDVRDPHAKTGTRSITSPGLVPFADRVQLSGFVRTQAEIDSGSGQVRYERESGSIRGGARCAPSRTGANGLDGQGSKLSASTSRTLRAVVALVTARY